MCTDDDVFPSLAPDFHSLDRLWHVSSTTFDRIQASKLCCIFKSEHRNQSSSEKQNDVQKIRQSASEH